MSDDAPPPPPPGPVPARAHRVNNADVDSPPPLPNRPPPNVSKQAPPPPPGPAPEGAERLPVADQETGTGDEHAQYYDNGDEQYGYYYDADGNAVYDESYDTELTDTTEYDENGNPISYEAEAEYDEDGNQISYDEEGNQIPWGQAKSGYFDPRDGHELTNDELQSMYDEEGNLLVSFDDLTLAPQVQPEEKKANPEVISLRNFLEQAIHAQDTVQMIDLVAKLRALSITDDDPLIAEAEAYLAATPSGPGAENSEELNTLRVYLKQALDAKDRKALQGTLQLAKKTPHAGNKKFESLVAHAETILHNLQMESAKTVSYYLNQGLQLRSRPMLQEAMQKLGGIPTEYIDQALLGDARRLLQRLDAENMVLSFVASASKQKNQQALETALQNAKKININPSNPVMVQGQELLALLQARANKKGKKAKRGLFSRQKKIRRTTMFGKPLGLSISTSPYIVPKVCYACVEYLMQHGLKHEGIFRVPGDRNAMEAIKRGFETGMEVKFDTVNNAAGVLKQYYRFLPEPLIPFKFYRIMIDMASSKDKDKKLAVIMDALEHFPKNELNTLVHLMLFLYEIPKHTKENNMTPNSVAICLAPNLLRPEQETFESMAKETGLAIAAVQFMIENVPTLFEPLRPNSWLKPK